MDGFNVTLMLRLCPLIKLLFTAAQALAAVVKTPSLSSFLLCVDSGVIMDMFQAPTLLEEPFSSTSVLHAAEKESEAGFWIGGK